MCCVKAHIALLIGRGGMALFLCCLVTTIMLVGIFDVLRRSEAASCHVADNERYVKKVPLA